MAEAGDNADKELVFGFEDLQALRDEYEERIRLLEAERAGGEAEERVRALEVERANLLEERARLLATDRLAEPAANPGPVAELEQHIRLLEAERQALYEERARLLANDRSQALEAQVRGLEEVVRTLEAERQALDEERAALAGADRTAALEEHIRALETERQALYQERAVFLTPERVAAPERAQALEEQLRVTQAQCRQALEQSQARQELIEDLTIELATAREESARLQQHMEARRVLANVQGQQLVNDVAKIELDLFRVKEALLRNQAPAAEQAPGPPPASIVLETQPPSPALPSLPPVSVAPSSVAPVSVAPVSVAPVSVAPTTAGPGAMHAGPSPALAGVVSAPTAGPPEIPADDLVTETVAAEPSAGSGAEAMPATTPPQGTARGMPGKKRKIRLR